MLELAELKRARAAVESKIAEIEARTREDRAEWRAQLGQSEHPDLGEHATDSTRRRIDLRSVKLQAHASIRDEMDLRRAALDLAAAAKREDESRARLLQAARARKAVEMLRERRLELWKQQQRRKEHLESDEIATMRMSRPAFGGIVS